MSKRTTQLMVKRSSDTYQARIDPEYRAVLDRFWAKPQRMTVRQVAQTIGCSSDTLRSKIRTGASPIPFTRHGNIYLADAKDVLAYKAAA